MEKRIDYRDVSFTQNLCIFEANYKIDLWALFPETEHVTADNGFAKGKKGARCKVKYFIKNK